MCQPCDPSPPHLCCSIGQVPHEEGHVCQPCDPGLYSMEQYYVDSSGHIHDSSANASACVSDGDGVCVSRVTCSSCPDNAEVGQGGGGAGAVTGTSGVCMPRCIGYLTWVWVCHQVMGEATQCEG